MIGAELRKDLVPRDANARREAELVLHALRYLPRDEQGTPARKLRRMRDVQPGLIQAKGLHEVRVLIVQLSGQARIPLVEPVARRHHDGIGAGPARLPQRRAGLHASALCRIACGEHDAVAVLLVAANNDGKAAQLGPLGHFDRCVEAVHVDVKHYPIGVHGAPFPIRTSVW